MKTNIYKTGENCSLVYAFMSAVTPAFKYIFVINRHSRSKLKITNTVASGCWIRNIYSWCCSFTAHSVKLYQCNSHRGGGTPDFKFRFKWWGLVVSDSFDYKRMRDKYNDPNNFNIKIESTNHSYYCYFFSANTGLWHRFAIRNWRLR